MDSDFFGEGREGIEVLGRGANGLMKRGCASAGVVATAAATAFGCPCALRAAVGAVVECAYEADCAGALISGGSEEGGSEPMLGLSGVRKGDLNGLLKVSEASFSLRRLACGVDIVICRDALGAA